MNKRVIVITGGAQGIGKAIAHRFLQDGFAVVITDSDAEAGAETLTEYAALGDLRFFPGDISQQGDVLQLATDTVATFGRVDVLVNNAAISHNAPVTELSLEDWNRVLGVNLTGPFLCAKHLAGELRKQRGCIINIASTRAFMSEPNTEAYSASKGGLAALTHALAASLAPDVRVNSISPGWIETQSWRKSSTRTQPVLTDADHQQHWAGRVGEPGDIANLTAFLASDKSGFITGSNFVVDGGMTRKMIYC